MSETAREFTASTKIVVLNTRPRLYAKSTYYYDSLEEMLVDRSNTHYAGIKLFDAKNKISDVEELEASVAEFEGADLRILEVQGHKVNRVGLSYVREVLSQGDISHSFFVLNHSRKDYRTLLSMWYNYKRLKRHCSRDFGKVLEDGIYTEMLAVYPQLDIKLLQDLEKDRLVKLTERVISDILGDSSAFN